MSKFKIVNKFKTHFFNLLKQGTSPRELAFGVSGAIMLGIFPMLGVTTLLCTAFALKFKLNQPTVQLVNFSVYPFQIALFVPWMILGEYIFGFAELNYSFKEIMNLIETDLWMAIKLLWNVNMQGVATWFLVAPILTYILFKFFEFILKLIKRRIQTTNEEVQ